MRTADLDRIAARGHRAAELLDTHGRTAIRNAIAQARPIIRATSYGNQGPGNTYDPQDGRATTTNDPTGTTATARTTEHHTTRVLAAITAYEQASGNLTDLILTNVTEARADHDTTTEPPDDPDTNWCTSCERDNGHLEPIARHTDGRTKYAGSCSWCHAFTKNYRRPAPIELLRLRHQGHRITDLAIRRAIRNEHHNR